jgi:hypothetical protein
MTWLYVLLAVGVPLGVLIFAVMYASKRAREQQKASEMRLQAMFNAMTRAAEKKKEEEAAAAGAPVTPERPAVEVRDERECPYCAEPILKKARVCKHCGRDVEPLT